MVQPMNSYLEFAALLSRLIGDLDRPAAWLANRLGVSPSTVTRWLNGETRPGKPETIARLADILAVYDPTERQALLAAAGYAYQEASSKEVSDFFAIDRANEKPHKSWGEAPDVSLFYGREGEIARLEAWLLQDRCRLVGVLGIGGIGKTALVTRLAQQVQDQFDYLAWSSLRNAPSLEEVLADWILFLSDQRDYDLPANIDQRLSLLLGYLRQ